MTKEQKEAVTYKPSDLNLYQKLAAIMGEIGIIAKDGKNKEQNYAFIEYASVAGRLRDLLSKYGVVIVPKMPKAADQQREEIVSSYGKKGVAVLIDFTFVVVNADKPDDQMEVPWTGEAADFGDKATNKAATAALKYYLMRQFNISEKGDDPDAASPDRGEVQRSSNAPAEQRPTKQPSAKRPTILDDLQRAIKGLKARGLDKDTCRSIIYGIAGVESPKELTREAMARVFGTLKSAKISELREMYAVPATDPTAPSDDKAPSVTDAELAELDQEAKAQRQAEQPEPEHTAVWTVPEYKKPNAPAFVHPNITAKLKELMAALELDEASTATWMTGIVSKPWPKTHDEAIAAIEAAVYKLNEREQAARTNQPQGEQE
jgi:hypothetical protein